MKIITFLGFNKYIETTYIHPTNTNIKVSTAFFQEALVEFYQPEVIYVLLTDTVEYKKPRDQEQTN
jgi:hypothetical protein